MPIELAADNTGAHQRSLLTGPGAPRRLELIVAQATRDTDTTKSALQLIEQCTDALDAHLVAVMQRDAAGRALLQRCATCLHNIVEAWCNTDRIPPDLVNEAHQLIGAAQQELEEGGA